MQQSLIDQGISLMLYGMGTVFVFLTILVFATLLMSWIVSRLPAAAPQPESNNDSAAVGGQPSPQIRAAIKLAIEQHRQATRTQR